MGDSPNSAPARHRHGSVDPAPALFQAFEHHHAAGQVDLPGGQGQGFGNPTAGGVQGAAEGAYLARGLGGGGQEGAALLLGPVTAKLCGLAVCASAVLVPGKSRA